MKEGMKEEGGKGRIKRKEEKKEDEGRRNASKSICKTLAGRGLFFWSLKDFPRSEK